MPTKKSQPKPAETAAKVEAPAVKAKLVVPVTANFPTLPNLPGQPTDFKSRKRLRKFLRKNGLSIKNFDVQVSGDQNHQTITLAVKEAPKEEVKEAEVQPA